MDVLLKPELEKFVMETVKSGRYAHASDVVNAALEVLQEQEQFSEEHEGYLRRELQRGLDELEREQYSQLDVEGIIAQERRRMAEGK